MREPKISSRELKRDNQTPTANIIHSLATSQVKQTREASVMFSLDSKREEITSAAIATLFLVRPAGYRTPPKATTPSSAIRRTVSPISPMLLLLVTRRRSDGAMHLCSAT